MPYRTCQSVEYGYGWRTEFPKGSGTVIDRCCTKLTKGSGTGMDVLRLYPYPYLTSGISTGPYPVPGYFPAGVPNLPKRRVRVWLSYRTYRSVGYGYGIPTKLTKVSYTGNTRRMYPLNTLVRTLPNTNLQLLLLVPPAVYTFGVKQAMVSSQLRSTLEIAAVVQMYACRCVCKERRLYIDDVNASTA